MMIDLQELLAKIKPYVVGWIQTTGGSGTGYVLKAGDTMTGALYMGYDTPAVAFKNTGSSNKEWALRGYGSDWGLYESSAGAFRLFALAGGNVGIGTTGPGSALDIKSAPDQLRVREADSAGYMFMRYHTSGTYGSIGVYDVSIGGWRDLALQSGGGNVGIRTANPAGMFHALGSYGEVIYWEQQTNSTTLYTVRTGLRMATVMVSASEVGTPANAAGTVSNFARGAGPILTTSAGQQVTVSLTAGGDLTVQKTTGTAATNVALWILGNRT